MSLKIPTDPKRFIRRIDHLDYQEDHTFPFSAYESSSVGGNIRPENTKFQFFEIPDLAE